MLNSLWVRLTLSYFLVTLICLAVISGALLFLMQPIQTRLTYSRLLDRAIPTVLWVHELLQRGVPPTQIAERFQEQEQRQGFRIFLLNQKGVVLADSGETDSMVDQHLEAFVRPDSDGARWPLRGGWVSPEGQTYRYLSLPAVNIRTIKRPLPPDTIYVALATQEKIRVAVEILPFLLLAVVVGLLVSTVVALVMAHSVSKPLSGIALAAERISNGDYDQTLRVSGPSEVGRLAASFNRMARQVKAAQESQRDFIANVSHELKTPLTSIQGFAQAILDGTARVPEAQQKAARIIKGEAERMSRLVNDLLVLAKVSSDRDRSTWVDVDLLELLHSCTERISVLAAQKDIVLKLESSGEPGPSVRGDPDRLAQLFINLLDNAVKYSPPGTAVSLAICTAFRSTGERRRRHSQWIEVQITDSGPGIPPEQVSRIFERFYQVDKSRAGQRGSSGLGLAIAKEIVDMHDGYIGVESRQGAGATFIVTLPAAQTK